MLRLAIPVVVVQVGMMAMGVADTVMAGHYSGTALAAVALGNVYFYTVAVFGMGTLLALDPVISQAVGAGDDVAIARGLQRGLLMAAGLSMIASVLLIPGEAFLTLLGQPEEVIPVAADYARASIPGVFPFLAFWVLRQTLQAMERLRPIVITILAANVVNIILNWMLVYGKLGAPELGAVGTGWASSISRGLVAAGLLLLAWRELRPYLIPLRRDALLFAPFLRMLRLGAPIGLQFQLEYGAFATVAIMMGWLGPVPMAAHQIAINLASLTFMVPVGVAAAAAVLVGQSVGRRDMPAARRFGMAALLIGAGFMSVSAVVFLAAPGLLARLYSVDPLIIALAVTLIPIAGVFQVFDGLQAVAGGVLRGVGDTRSPLVVNLLGFWLFGVPISIYLGFRTPAGPAGLWWGFVAGLLAVSVILVARVRIQLRRDIARVLIDADHPLPGVPEPLADARAAAGP
ncbi:MAG: MATE family efflux transporter [Gemmatimonadaceae bacterium]